MNDTTNQPAAGTGQGDPQQQQQQQGEPFWNTLPENMRGGTAEDTLKKLLPSWQGYHKQWTERAPVLQKPEDVSIEMTNEKAKPFFDAKSPMMTAFANVAVKAGLTKVQAQQVADGVMGQLADGGHLAESYDQKAAVIGIAKVLGFDQINDQAKAALQQFETEGIAWAENTAKQLGLSEVGTAELESLVLTPGGAEIVRALQKQAGSSFALGGKPGGDGQFFSKEELHKLDGDPRIDPSKFDKFDKMLRAKYDASYQHHYVGKV